MSKLKHEPFNWEIYVSGCSGKILAKDMTYPEAVEQAEQFGKPFAITQISPQTLEARIEKNDYYQFIQ